MQVFTLNFQVFTYYEVLQRVCPLPFGCDCTVSFRTNGQVSWVHDLFLTSLELICSNDSVPGDAGHYGWHMALICDLNLLATHKIGRCQPVQTSYSVSCSRRVSMAILSISTGKNLLHLLTIHLCIKKVCICFLETDRRQLINKCPAFKRPHIFITVFKELTTEPILSQMNPGHTLSIFNRDLLSSHLHLGLLVVSSLQVFQPKLCKHFSGHEFSCHVNISSISVMPQHLFSDALSLCPFFRASDHQGQDKL
jgi:hypothetical protein